MSESAATAIHARAVMLSGEEEALRRRALTDLVALATQDGDFDVQTYEGDQETPADWIASAGVAPFLSARRTVVVRHLLRQEPENLSGLKTLPESALLILVADEETGDERKQGKLTTIRKAWEKAVGGAGGTVLSFKTEPKQVREAVKKEVERIGKKISDATAESLCDMTGGSLSRAIEEIEKLALYVGNETQIREADIRAVVVPSREWSVFKLIDAIIDGAVPEALRQLRILVGSIQKTEDAAYGRLLPMMSRQLRLMWQARLCVDAKRSPQQPGADLLRLFPEKPNFAKEPPYRHSRVMQQAKRVDLEALQRCFEAVSDADARLKGMLDSYSSIDTLEQMVLRMVEVIGSRSAVR